MRKKIIGYTLLVLSCMTWLLIPFVGLLGLSTAQSAILLTTLVVLGEVCFLLSIVFLGKEIWEKIKHFSKAWWRWIVRKFRNKNKT